jgi:hypothetical protein
LVLIFAGIPLAVWFLALMVWFFWPDIQGLFRPAKTAAPAGADLSQQRDRAKQRGPQAERAAREQIPEEDRQKLEDLLKRR